MDSASHSLSKYDLLSNFRDVIPIDLKIRPMHRAQEAGSFQISVENRVYHYLFHTEINVVAKPTRNESRLHVLGGEGITSSEGNSSSSFV